ncbi:MAG: 2-amino-4-oxopentanoate thiolase subunit OrtA [Bacillota bacterium]|nr:2-amino-4-oxopentanoate thiolase subunit OrtA [Bacillota bacterium]
MVDRSASENTTRVPAGEYVQIHSVVLKPGERAPQVPEDTQKVPLELRLKGYLDHDAHIGEEVTITTVLGRKARGRLVAVNPPYPHNFARPVPELLHIGEELWRLLGARDDRDGREGDQA